MLTKESLTEFFEKTRREAIKISFEKASEKLPVGASKFGGRPDLPSGFEWPYYGGKLYGEEFSYPLTFLMQINLEEIAPYDVEKRLPSRGFLYFFFERVEGANINVDLEDEQGDRGRVFYFDCSPSDLIETASPPHDGLERDFTFWDFELELAATFERTVSTPGFNSCLKRISGAEELPTEPNEELERLLAEYREWRAKNFGFESAEPSFDEEQTNIDASYVLNDYNYNVYRETVRDWGGEGGEEETRFFGYSNLSLNDDEPVFLQLGTITDTDDEGCETTLGWGDDTKLTFYMLDEYLRRADFDKVFVWGAFPFCSSRCFDEENAEERRDEESREENDD